MSFLITSLTESCVLSAGNGKRALQKVKELGGPIDLLVTDVLMPEMSGRELAQTLRAHHPHLAVLFISGYTSDVIGGDGVADQNTAFMQKPFTSTQLVERVRDVLDQRTP